MDNAGGGLRGLRPTPSQALLATVRRAYGIDDWDDLIDIGGSSSLNLCVGSGAERWVVRVYRKSMSDERLGAVHAVRRALAAAGLPCAEPVATRDGQSWLVFEGHLVEVERYVEHDAVMDTWERLAIGLPVLGRIHTVLRDLVAGDAGREALFANHIAAADVLDYTARGTRRIRAWGPTTREMQLAADADELARLVAYGEGPLLGQLPPQLVHGDFWDNNVLFRDGRVVAVVDFDFMGARPRIDDLALTLYFTCLAFYEEAVSDGQLRQLRRLLDAYDMGTDIPLTSSERAALPLAIARQPLWSIGGWVASLDDEATARRHAAGTSAEVVWALRLIREMGRWQDALA
jgi:Ser/Thr protein kinase RdoA (MazF antagonist)